MRACACVCTHELIIIINNSRAERTKRFICASSVRDNFQKHEFVDVTSFTANGCETVIILANPSSTGHNTLNTVLSPLMNIIFNIQRNDIRKLEFAKKTENCFSDYTALLIIGETLHEIRYENFHKIQVNIITLCIHTSFSC